MNLCIQKGLMQLVGYRDEGNKKKRKGELYIQANHTKIKGLLWATDLDKQAKYCCAPKEEEIIYSS